jgi:hypothetical protein
MARNELKAIVEVPKTGLPPFEPANFFHFMVSGPEISMLVGMIDINVIASMKQAAGRAGAVQQQRITPNVTHRFFLTARGLLILQQNVNDIVRQLEDMGVVIKDQAHLIATSVRE